MKTLDVICLDGDSEVRRRYQEFFALRNFRFKNASVTDLALAMAKNSFGKSTMLALMRS
jgi:hypothetical protein